MNMLLMVFKMPKLFFFFFQVFFFFCTLKNRIQYFKFERKKKKIFFFIFYFFAMNSETLGDIDLSILPREEHRLHIRRFLESGASTGNKKREIQREISLLKRLTENETKGMEWKNLNAGNVPCSAFLHLFYMIDPILHLEPSSALKLTYNIHCFISTYYDKLEPYLDSFKYYKLTEIGLSTMKKQIKSRGLTPPPQEEMDKILEDAFESANKVDVDDEDDIKEKARELITTLLPVYPKIDSVFYASSAHKVPLFIPILAQKRLTDKTFEKREMDAIMKENPDMKQKHDAEVNSLMDINPFQFFYLPQLPQPSQNSEQNQKTGVEYEDPIPTNNNVLYQELDTEEADMFFNSSSNSGNEVDFCIESDF